MEVTNQKSPEQIEQELKALDNIDLDKEVQEPEQEEPVAVQQPEQKQEEPVQQPQEELVPKEKFVNSQREALVLHARNQQFETSVEDASKITDVTDDEAKVKYPEWDMMTDTEKKLAKENMIAKKQFEIVNQAVQNTKRSNEWVEKVDNFLDDDKNIQTFPGLAGREKAFIKFVNHPTKVGLPLDDLAKVFLYNVTTNPVVSKQPGSMFNVGASGEKAKTDKDLTAADVQMIRKTDQKKYFELIRQGKIKFEV